MVRMRTCLVILMIFVVAGSVFPAQVAAQDVPTCVPPTGGYRPDAPYWAQHGPHWVGFTEFTIETGDRPIPVAMWYPALNPDCVEERITYEYDHETMVGIGVLSSMFPREGWAIRDAAPDLPEAPYPLVVYSASLFSHKLAGLVLGEHLASHGYVVMSGTYEDSPQDTTFRTWAHSLISRAQDLSRMIDYAETMNVEGTFADTIDTGTVAAIGYFTGDLAAAQVGGARFSFASAEVWSAENPTNQYGLAVVQYEDEMAQMLGTVVSADGLLPSLADRRVQAVVLMSPWTPFIGADGYRSLEVPTMLLRHYTDGYPDDDSDVMTEYEWFPAQDKALAVFSGAHYQVFLPPCRAARGQTIGDFSDCSDPVWDLARVDDVSNHLITAFLNYELKGMKRLCGALQSSSVNIPNVRFESTIRCNF